MKKLRLALGLVFALTFSLFLVACGGGNKEVTDIELEGMTTEFKEGDAFTTGNLVVTVYYRGSDDPVVLEADQYEVDSSAYKSDSAGTYQIIITPEQTPAEGAQPVTASYEVTVDHNWTDNGDGTFTCQCGAKRESFSGLTDTVTTTAWGNPATLTEVSEQSPATAPIAGENHVSYGSLVAGQSKALTLKILTVDTGSDWNTPLMGIRNGADGVLPREDNWVIATAAGFVAPWGTSTGYSATLGTATTASTEWEVFTRGTDWDAKDIEGGTIVVTYDYSLDSIMTIRHNLTKSDGTKLELVYSVKLPDAAYEIVAYGEKCTYQVTNIESVMNREVTGLTATLPTATVQPEGKLFNAEGLTTEASMSAGSPVVNSYNAYAYVDVANADGTTTPTRINLATEPLQAGMYSFNVEFAGQVYYFTSDGKMGGKDLITVIPSSFTAVGASAVSKSGVLFDAPNASFDYAVNDSENGIVIVGTGAATLLTEAQKEALDTTASAFVSFKISALAANITAVSVEGGYAALNNGVIDVVLPVGSEYTLTLKAGDAVAQEATVDLSDVTAPTAGAYVAESDFNLDKGGTYTVVYTGLSNVDELSLVTGGVRDTVANIKEAIATDGQFTALSGFYINSVEETAEGLEVVYKIAAPQVVNLSATNAYRAVEVRNADGETLVSLTLRYNMVFSDNPSGSYAKIADDTVVYVSRDVMYVIKAVSAEEVDGNVQYSDLFIDATLNVQNKVGESYDVSVSASADGVSADDSNTITLSDGAAAKAVTIGNVSDTTDYDYGALVVYQFSVTALGLRTEDNEATYYFTANEDTENGQETYTVYTVTGNTIEAKEVTPSGERSETQALTCVQDGIEAYTDENGFIYGAIVTPASGEHSFGEYNENNEAVCSVCKAVRTKYDLGDGTYCEITVLDRADGEVIANTSNDPNGWWAYSTESEVVSGNFTVKYSWTGADGNYPANGALMIVLADPADGEANSALHKRFLEGVSSENNNPAVDITTLTSPLWSSDSVVTYEVFYNGETSTFEKATANGNGYWLDAEFSVTATRIGSTLTVEEQVVAENGDVWTSTLTITNFTTRDLSFSLGGNIYHLADIRLNVGEVSTTVNESFDNPVVWNTWYDVPATLTQGRTLVVSGTQTSPMASIFHTVLWEFKQGFTGRLDAYGWSFTPGADSGEVAAFSGTYTVDAIMVDGTSYRPGVEEDSKVWQPLMTEIAKDCDYTLTFTWVNSSTVTVSVLLDNGVSTYQCDYTLTLVQEVDVLTLHLTAEAVTNFTVTNITLK